MNISGIELTQISPKFKCTNAYCTEIAPICFIGIDNKCDRNMGTGVWTHYSFGEHICDYCMNFFGLISKPSNRLSAQQYAWFSRFKEWRDCFKSWPVPCGKETKLTVHDFITNSLLPWWIKCNDCGRWRHASNGLATKPGIFSNGFTCSMISRLRENPCSLPEDQRVYLVLTNRANFQASMQLPGFMHNSRLIYLCSQYSPVLLGVHPPALGFPIDFSKSCNWSLNYPKYRKPFSEPNEFPIPVGAWSPVEIFKWEYATFPSMIRYPALYRAIRNTVIYLWNRGSLRLVTSKVVSKHLLVRGLIRIVVVDEWLPFLLAQLTHRGLINIGFCAIPSPCSEPSRNVVIGSMDLKSAMLYRQLKNSFELDRRNATRCDFQDAVEFLTLEHTPTPSVFTVSQFTNGSEETEHEQIKFLNHSIGNHVVDPVNSNVLLLAHQLNLSAFTESSPTIFNPNGERLLVVFQDVVNRVQKYSYELFSLLMISNTFSNILSIQDMFDEQHLKMMERLSAVADFRLDSQLCEYFLACIEERLIERMLVSDSDENVPSTVSLCDMTPMLLHSFLSKRNPFYSRTLHFLTNRYNPLTFSDLNVHKTLVRQLIDPSLENNRVCSVVMTHIGPQSGLYILRLKDTLPQQTASVLVTLPSSSLKIIFCDDPFNEAIKSHPPKEEVSVLSIYLPHHFRLPLHQADSCFWELSKVPLCMSVTLLYPSPWWRPLLSEAMEPSPFLLEDYGVDLDALPEDNKPPSLFSFIPEGRSSRGFCHNFRDLSPSNSAFGVGVIQADILSQSIESHWPMDDAAVVRAVHSYLTKSLKAGKDKVQEYTASKVNCLFPAATDRDAPYLEARSANPALARVNMAVHFNDVREPAVEASGLDFSITEDWWRLLSDGASIHCLPMFALCEPSQFAEVEAPVKDPLSWEMTMGLKWSKHYFSENLTSGWSERRTVTKLKAAAINAHKALCTKSCTLMEDSNDVDDGDDGDDDEAENRAPSVIERNTSHLRRSARFTKPPCTVNL